MHKLFLMGGLGIILIYTISKKTTVFIALLLFLFLYSLNFSTPIGLDFRAFLTLAIVGTIALKHKKEFLFSLKKVSLSNLFIISTIFYGYGFLITYYNYNIFYGLKLFFVRYIMLVLGFFVASYSKNFKIIVWAFVISSFLGSADVLFSYIYARNNLSIIKIIDYFILHKNNFENHNYNGLISAFSLISFFCVYEKKITIFKQIIMGFLFFGIIISTSRSALLGLLSISPILLFKSSNFNLSSTFKYISIVTLFFITAYLAVFILPQAIGIDSQITELIKARVFEQPLEKISSYQGKSTLGSSMDFREDLWEISLNEYSKFSTVKQIFGIGITGFKKKISDHYSAHNLFLVTLIEKGIIGLILLGLFFLVIFYNTFKLKNVPLKFMLGGILGIFLMIFSFGQNFELLHPVNFFMFGHFIWANYRFKIEKKTK